LNQVKNTEQPLQIDALIAINDPSWIREVKDVRKDAELVVKMTLECMRSFLPAVLLNLKDEAIGLAVVLTDNKEMQELNYRFRGKNVPTNVLSFPADLEAPQPEEQEMVLGDIILAYGVVKQEAIEQGKPFAHHMTHMMVHGLLHLLGFDHMSEAEAEAMEAHERDILSRFNIPDPYALVGSFMNHPPLKQPYSP
jgi:probable rRNA maturation factor